MGTGDELRVGKIAGSTDIYSMGMPSVDNSSLSMPTVASPDADYNGSRSNPANNNIGKFGLLAQHTTTKFDSASLDIKFNDGAGKVGLGSSLKSPTSTKEFIA